MDLAKDEIALGAHWLTGQDPTNHSHRLIIVTILEMRPCLAEQTFGLVDHCLNRRRVATAEYYAYKVFSLRLLDPQRDIADGLRLHPLFLEICVAVTCCQKGAGLVINAQCRRVVLLRKRLREDVIGFAVAWPGRDYRPQLRRRLDMISVQKK